MRTTLLALHGFTLNGETMRAQTGRLATSLAASVDLVYPDAPHLCDEATVERSYARWRIPDPPPRIAVGGDANDDGSVYEGWEATRDRLGELLTLHAPAAVLGFSQGAMVAAAVSTLAARGELPAIRFAILIAGRVPRAKAIAPLFDPIVRVPSLHVWGERDTHTRAHALDLAEKFEPRDREIVTWRGSHAIPEVGPAKDAIVRFVERFA